MALPAYVGAERAHFGKVCSCYHCDASFPSGTAQRPGHIGIFLYDRVGERFPSRRDMWCTTVFLDGHKLDDVIEACPGEDGYVVRVHLPVHQCGCEPRWSHSHLDQSHACCYMQHGCVVVVPPPEEEMPA